MAASSVTTPASRPMATPRSVLDARWFFPLVAVLCVAAAYARAPLLGLVYDDDIIVKANPYITSVRYIPTYFTEHVWTNLMLARKNYYRPAFLLWLLAGYKEFGTDPLGWHVSCLLVHLGSVVMLYHLALRMTRSRFASLGAALLFGLHPVQVENVVWTSAVTELMCTFLALASLLCYLRSLDFPTRRTAYLSASIFLYFLAMFTKETAIIIPVIVFLHEWLGRPACMAAPAPQVAPRKRFVQAFLQSVPFGVVAIGYLAARVAVLGALGETNVAMSKRVWLETLPGVLQIYVTHLVWPSGLSLFYDYGYTNVFSFRGVVLPALMLLVLLVGLCLAVRKSAAGQLAAAWMAIAILPVLDLPVFPRGEFLHDRYLYHPMIGVALLGGLGIAAIERWRPPPAVLNSLYGACGVVALALGIVTFRQTAYWKDDFALYSRGVSVAPNNAFANTDLGSVLLGRGQWDEAMALFQKAVYIAPKLYLAHHDIGLAYYEVGRYQEAEASFRRAMEIMPQFPDAPFFLGMTYFHTDRVPEAIEYVRKAIALKGDGVNYHFALGVMLKQQGDAAGARAEFERELKRDPKHQPSLEQLQLLDAAQSSAAAKP